MMFCHRLDWRLTNDFLSRLNWPTWIKCVVAAQMGILTFSVYVGSAIYTGGLEGIMAQFTVSRTTALLGLTLFVLGYGIGQPY